jgi:hypothetical protein
VQLFIHLHPGNKQRTWSVGLKPWRLYGISNLADAGQAEISNG